MNKDLLNILSNSDLSGKDKKIDNQQLMDYLSGKLSNPDQYELEKLMADSDFMNDAVEGLQQIDNKKDVQTYVDELNAALQKNLQKKKQRREKRQLKDNPWSYVAVLLILLLCIAAYFVVRKVQMVH